MENPWTKIEIELTQVEKEQLELLAKHNNSSLARYIKTLLKVHLHKEKEFVLYLRKNTPKN